VGVFGGAERYLQTVTRHLQSRGVAVSLSLVGVKTAFDEDIARRLGAGLDLVTWTRWSSDPRTLWKHVRGLRPDLLHWNFIEPFAFEGAALVLLPWGRPSVITDHLPMMRNGVHRELTRRLANRRIAAMIVVGGASNEAAREHWSRCPPTYVVRNAVEVTRPHLRRTPRRDEEVRLLFVGRLEAQKNPLLALRVLRALRQGDRNVVLRVLGEGTLRAKMEEYVADAGLQEVVAFRGFRDDPWADVSDAHLLLCPSLFEGRPLTPLEALATGLPVLASNIPAHVEVASENPGLRVVASGHPDDWAAAASAMINDLSRLSAAACTTREASSVDHMIDGTLAVYRAVLDSGDAPRGNGRP
jgi:glycosyltransferase involved in cell wall biosynthesis